MSTSDWFIYVRNGLTGALVKLGCFNIIGLPRYVGVFERFESFEGGQVLDSHW